MPTFTALALDRLIEPRDSKSVDMPVSNSKPPLKLKPVPNPISKLQRRNSTSVVTDRKTERKVKRPQITPALYTTPETTPLPDSPSSFPPSPYIINHKRRGQRLLKSFSQADVTSCKKEMDEGEVVGNTTKDVDGDATKNTEIECLEPTRSASVTFVIPDPSGEESVSDFPKSPIAKECVNGLHDVSTRKEHLNGVYNGELGSGNEESDSSNRGFGSTNGSSGLTRKKDALKLIALSSDRDSESDDFFDPQDSMSHTSNTDVEDNTGPESSAKVATPMGGEFYDAWEELSSESGPQSSRYDIEAELQEIRLSLSMEIEKRKQAEESLNDMQSQWQRIRQQLAHVGLTLPADLTAMDPAEELCRQVYLARFVSESVGRGIAKAEMEAEMEAQIEAKNFEIARLCDRLHYYEAMNREMCQRNQEAVEMARRDRQRRKKRQRWVWGSIVAAITLGTAALAWSYLPTGKGSTSNGGPQAPEHDHTTNH